MPWTWFSRKNETARERSAKIPPSPRLSARMMKPRYFTATTTTRDQKTRERTPRTLVSVMGMAWSPWKHSLTA